MYEHVLQQIGVNRNEALIYETLLREGDSGVGRIAAKSNVHRRNVYDSIKKLVELGLAFEILTRRERMYRAAEPERLYEMLDEQQERLSSVMPALEALYFRQSAEHRVAMYRGAEGWKNYMRDMLRESNEAHFIGAKGAWLDERVQHFFPFFDEQARGKGMRFYHLFDYEVQLEVPQILPHVGVDYKFLPRGYSTPSAVDVFGDHVNMIPEVGFGRLGSDIRVIVIVNRQVAEAFRTWFNFMWNICPDPDPA